MYAAQFHSQIFLRNSPTPHPRRADVKWLEGAGARVVLLPYHASDADVDELFGQVNGALFPGGGSDVPAAAKRMYANAVAANAAGDHFPIWGTCDGFEWLMQIAANDDQVLDSPFDSENITLPLNLTAAAATSTLLADANVTPVVGAPGARPIVSVLDAAQAQAVNMHNHQQGIEPATFAASDASKVFKSLATNVDRKGRPFVSVVEGHTLPFYATQFHPEKPLYEWGVQGDGRPYEVIAHSPAAVATSQYFANFFVGQCRKSAHEFDDGSDLWKRLVYHSTTSTAAAPGFVQVYMTSGDAARAVD